MKKFIIASIVLLSFFGVVSPAFAQVYQAPVNKGQTSSVISVNKTVHKPGTKSFVENLGTNDAKYQPGTTVPFQIVVTNTGTTTLSNIKITDTFPKFMVNEADMKPTATFSIPTLEAGKSQTFTLSGLIANTNSLPNDQRVFCLVNQAAATTNNQTSTDNAQLCVENPAITEQVATPSATTKGGLPVYQPQVLNATPGTGPETLALAFLAPSGLLGYILRKRTK